MYEVFELNSKEYPLTKFELESHKIYLYESMVRATFKEATSDGVTTIYTVPDEARWSGVKEVSIWNDSKKIYDVPLLDRSNLEESINGYYMQDEDIVFYPKPPRDKMKVRIYWLKKYSETGAEYKYEGREAKDIVVGIDNLKKMFPETWRTSYRISYGTHCHICHTQFSKRHNTLVQEIEEMQGRKDLAGAGLKKVELERLWLPV